jgi:hypothetical protein
MSGERPWGLLIAALVAAAVLGAFVLVVLLDRGQRTASEPPEGVQEFTIPSRNHTEEVISYPQSPPAGGNHNPVWQNSGFYADAIRNENAVHTLEHGAVWITYRPSLPQAQKDTLREVAQSQDCIIASPYPDLPAPVVASAWGVQLQLNSADDPRLERFVRTYRVGPQTPEPGAACTGGIGEPS